MVTPSRQSRKPPGGQVGLKAVLCPLLLFQFAAGWPRDAGAALPAVNALSRTEAVRSQALGGAGVALGYDPSLVWLNPASAARAERSSIILTGAKGYFDDVTGEAVGAFPVFGAVLSLAAVYDDAGEATVIASDLTERRVHARQDVLLCAGLAGPLTAGLTGGVTVKRLRSTLAEEFVTTAMVFDAGVQASVSSRVKVGASVQNLGTGVKYLDDRVGLPSVARAGVAYAVHTAGAGEDSDYLILLSDLEYPLRENAPGWNAGAEYRFHGILAVRLGAQLGAAHLGRLSAGLGLLGGLRDKDRSFGLDYSIRLLTGGFGVPQMIAVTWSF
jgi:hypothetical protein